MNSGLIWLERRVLQGVQWGYFAGYLPNNEAGIRQKEAQLRLYSSSPCFDFKHLLGPFKKFSSFLKRVLAVGGGDHFLKSTRKLKVCKAAHG